MILKNESDVESGLRPIMGLAFSLCSRLIQRNGQVLAST